MQCNLSPQYLVTVYLTFFGYIDMQVLQITKLYHVLHRRVLIPSSLKNRLVHFVSHRCCMKSIQGGERLKQGTNGIPCTLAVKCTLYVAMC